MESYCHHMYYLNMSNYIINNIERMHIVLDCKAIILFVARLLCSSFILKGPQLWFCSECVELAVVQHRGAE